MLNESAPKDAPWSQVSRMVFWSRDVSLDVWRAGTVTIIKERLARQATQGSLPSRP